MMDVGLLEKGGSFDALPETWVIFITENDVVGHGKPLYLYERRLADTGERLNDGTYILYVNGAYRGDTPLGQLMHDFSCADPDDMHYGLLADRVRFFKQSKEGVEIMCRAIEEIRMQERKEGWEEGHMEGQKGEFLATVRALHEAGQSLEFMERITRRSRAEVIEGLRSQHLQLPS